MNITIGGIGNTRVKCQDAFTCRVGYFCNDLSETGYFRNVQVVEPLVGDVLVTDWNNHKRGYAHLQDIAFPVPVHDRRIDLLIGTDHGRLLAELRPSVVGARGADPVARLTCLGWTAAGKQETNGREEEQDVLATINMAKLDAFTSRAAENAEVERLSSRLESLLELIERFKSDQGLSESDEITISALDTYCLERLSTLKSMEDGKRVLPCLWKRGQPQISCNFNFALSRLDSLFKSKKFLQEGVREEVQKIFSGYEKEGYITRLVKNPGPSFKKGPMFYWAHFAVVRTNRETTKVRPVFDGAAKCLGGECINDKILPGPKLINDLSQVLLRFRRHEIGIMCDIKAMFLQVRLMHEDRKYHRFLWYDNAIPDSKELLVYEWNSHVFGNAGSPTVAIWSIKECAREHMSEYPRAAETVLHSTIVDDNIDSVATEEEAIALCKDLVSLYKHVGMELTKFSSNSKAVLESIPEDMRSKNVKGLVDISVDPDFDGKGIFMKALGQLWDMKSDTILYQYTPPEPDTAWTKWEILSYTHKVFDPLGLLCPFFITSRLLLQDLWRQQKDWTDPLDEEFLVKWRDWLKALPEIEKISVPRLLTVSNPTPTSCTLEIFTDASKDAMACVAYVRQTFENASPRVAWAKANARVKPIKVNRDIPKLELMSIELGCQLGEHARVPLGIELTDVYVHSDSMTALYWIRMTDDTPMHVLVKNYQRKIRKLLPIQNIKWVAGAENPADVATRAIRADELVKSDLWWNGPQFLRLPRDEWRKQPDITPKDAEAVVKEVQKDYRRLFSFHAEYTLEVDGRLYSRNLWDGKRELERQPDGSFVKKPFLAKYFKNFLELVETCALALRYCDWPPSEEQLSERGHPRKIREDEEPISSSEFRDAEKALACYSQLNTYGKTLQQLRLGKVVRSNKLSKLGIYLDLSGKYPLIRLAGRLKDATHLSEEMQRPILLHPEDEFTQMVITYYHEKKLDHTGGIKCLVCELNKCYWIAGSIRALKRVMNRCIECRLKKASTQVPHMGSLPESRIPSDLWENCPANFSTTMLDCAGPWLVKQGRGKVQVKRWCILFVDMLTTALHVELLEEMSADAFIRSLECFNALRSRPRKIICDNGTNFVGGFHELTELWKLLKSSKVDIERHFDYEIQFDFSPPYSPHFNGLVERMVYAVKTALRAVLPQGEYSHVQLHTAVQVASGHINNRPIGVLGLLRDPKDMEPLTPNHFLRGGIFRQLAPFSKYTSRKLSCHYLQLNKFLDAFWKRLVTEVTPFLRRYNKWQTNRENLKEGDIAMQLTMERKDMPLVVITKVFPGKDGIVRKVETKFTLDGEAKLQSVKNLAVILSVEEQTEEAKKMGVDNLLTHLQEQKRLPFPDEVPTTSGTQLESDTEPESPVLPDIQPEPVKRRRGRPPGSKNKSPLKERQGYPPTRDVDGSVSDTSRGLRATRRNQRKRAQIANLALDLILA